MEERDEQAVHELFIEHMCNILEKPETTDELYNAIIDAIGFEEELIR